MTIAGVYCRKDATVAPPSADDEYAVLVNTGDDAVDVTGWWVTRRALDGTDHYRSHLPRFLANGDLWLLEPGGTIFLHTGRGTSFVVSAPGDAPQYHFFFHRNTHVWQESGASACLFDRQGELVSGYEMPGVRTY